MDLIESLKSELSGDFERLIVALMYSPFKYDAKELHDAMRGLGTSEDTIIEILASRTKAQIREIIKAYKEEYNSDLEEDIKSETSGYFEQILVCLLQVMVEKRNGDPKTLMVSSQGSHKHRQCSRQTPTCHLEAKHSENQSDKSRELPISLVPVRDGNFSIEDTIKSETRGSLEDAMLAIGKSYYASFTLGAGTDDGTLIRVIVSRSEVDLNLIKVEFKKIAGQSLSSMILDDTSGDYKTALLTLCGSDD
uniref:Annexin n=1 Tax=Nothoprocta perdicaria TaxID=30464 RepID=A0A8C6ZMT5_NOTPE